MTCQRSLSFVVVVLIVTLHLGCDRRSYYRQEADREVDLLLDESASINPLYRYDNFNVQMDPRSRFYYDQDPDLVPMPQDDPDSNQLMKVIDGKIAWPRWEENGITNQFENPYWREQVMEYAGVTQDGNVLLDIDSSLLLAQLHSPTYQNQKETLYQSALDVSAERFRFDTQFFGGTDVAYSHLGRLRAGGEANVLRVDNTLELRKRFANAGSLLVGVANSFVFTFTGDNTDFGFSLLNFSLVQPLLRNGGRVIALETLTIAERALFANLRAFQRYRRGFFTNVAIGTNGTSGPQRRGGFLGGTGLTGFTGTGAGGIGGVGAGTFGFGGGFGGGGGANAATGTGLAGGGAGNVGGFIGLLQSLQQYRNARDSLDLQIRTLALLEGNLEGGVVDVVEVDQFRQTIETQRAQLLQSQNGLQRQIEGYLTGTLGLPPDLGVELDDQFIRRFQLIDPVITQFQNDVYRIQTQIGELPEVPSREELAEIIDAVKANRSNLIEYFPSIRDGVEIVDQAITKRKSFLEQKELEELEKNAEQWKSQLDPILERLKANGQPLFDIESNLTDANTAESTTLLVNWMRNFLAQTQEIVLLQARTRLQNVYIDSPVRLDIDCALTIAYNNRLDYMNARASLVDTWRLIEFNANSLLSDLTITADGDIRTNKNNITNFRVPAGRANVGIEFDAPFTRLLERNNYRGALLEYQAARRSFVQATDGINASMRNYLRTLNELELNLEIQRRAVDIAIRRVEVTEAKLQEPPNADDPNRFGPTDVQNLSSALADLRNSQNNLMSVWLNYHANRMLLIRDLGIMQLDENGRWVDVPIDENLCLEQNYDCECPPAIPQEWIDQAFDGEEEVLPGGKPATPKTNKSLNYFGAENAGENERNYLEEKGGLVADEEKTEPVAATKPKSLNPFASLFQNKLKKSPEESKTAKYLDFKKKLPEDAKTAKAPASEKVTDKGPQQIAEKPAKDKMTTATPAPQRVAKKENRPTAQPKSEKVETEEPKKPTKTADDSPEEKSANPSNLRWAHRLKAPSQR